MGTFVALLFLLALHFKRGDGDWRPFKTRARIVSVYLVFFFQPSVVKESLTLFSCITVGDERVLYSSVDINCDSSSHLRWEILGAFSLFVFAALLPLLVL